MPSELERSDQESEGGHQAACESGIEKHWRRISTVRGLSHAWIAIDQEAGMARLAI
jgi:hypothetical protein